MQPMSQQAQYEYEWQKLWAPARFKRPARNNRAHNRYARYSKRHAGPLAELALDILTQAGKLDTRYTGRYSSRGR